MHNLPPPSQDTLEIIRRLRAAAARRRKIRLIALAGAAVLVGVTVVIIAFALTGQTPQTTPESTSTTVAPTTDAGVISPVQTTLSTIEDTTSSSATSVQVAAPVSTSTTAAQGRFVVVVDPGHQAAANYDREPVGPGSTTTKAKVSSGTRSVNTGQPESLLVLAVSLKLRDSLQAHGITVIMTRTTQEVDISNVERAQLANQAGADLFVRIHADGATDTSIHGILMLYPASIAGWTDDIAAESKRAALLALDHLVTATGARDRGLSARGDISGFNWSDVPVILPEIGLMTNPAEDALLATDDYQGKIVQGLTDAILEYLGVS